jgi:DNA polymerase IV
MLRQIVCFQVPSLHIAVARASAPSLCRRPVAVAPPTARAVLFEVSAEATAEGVCAGMPLDLARLRCPGLKIIGPQSEKVPAAHAAVLESLRYFSPVWEPIRPGHFYLDLTGTARLFGRAVDTAARMEREVLERHDFSGVAGVATNKLVSHIAADAIVKPPDLCGVDPGAEKAFLAPQPVAALPSLHRLCGGKTPEFLEMLGELDLATLGRVAATPPGHLELVVGARSRLMQQWAAGFDPTPVWPAERRPSREASYTLAPDEIDDAALCAALYGLLERLCRELRAAERLCAGVRLDLVQSDGVEFSGRAPLAAPSHWECDLYPPLEKLYFRLFQRRVRIRRMTLAAEKLAEPSRQLSLFPEQPAAENLKQQRLAAALDAVRARFGKNAVGWGSA